MFVEQPHAQGDTDDRVDDHQKRLGDPHWSDVKRHLLQEGACPTARAYRGQCVNIPATPNWLSMSVVALPPGPCHGVGAVTRSPVVVGSAVWSRL
jgi:hypothetical protein